MRGLLKITLFILVAVFLVHQFLPDIKPKLLLLWDDLKSIVYQAPCEKPIPYVMGTFDDRFGVSEKYFLGAVKDAEDLWEKASGINLFDYALDDKDKDVLKVNMVYDSRQQTTNMLEDLGLSVQDDRAYYDELKAKFLTLKAEYESKLDAFNKEVQVFNQENQNYEQEVNSWNAKGGAPKSEYDRLQKERENLISEAGNLKTTEAELRDMAGEVDALVNAVNRIAKDLNLSVEKYNTIGEARGESFEEGVYHENGNTRTIDIFEWSDRTKLVRTLAHEFGHALGIDHLLDPEAVMYEFNQGKDESLTDADLSALKAVCGLK